MHANLISCEYTTQEVGILISVSTTDTHTVFKGELDLIICQPFKYL